MTETNFVFKSLDQAAEAFDFYYYQPKRAAEGLRYVPQIAECVTQEAKDKFRIELGETFLELMLATWDFIEKTLREDGFWKMDIPEIFKTALWNGAFANSDNVYGRLKYLLNSVKAWQQTPLGGNDVVAFDKATIVDNYRKYLSDEEEIPTQNPYADLCEYLAQQTGYWIDSEKCRDMFDKFVAYMDITTAVDVVEDVCKIIMEAK